MQDLESQETERRIRKAISEILSRHVDDDVNTDLGCDSLDRIEIAMLIEDEFGIEAFADDELEGLKSVGDWFELVTKKIGEDGR